MSKQNNINKILSEKGINSNNLNDIEDGEIINDLFNTTNKVNLLIN